jgi:hypothetical protein
MNTYSKAGTVLALALPLLGAGCSDFLSGVGLTENPNNPTAGTALQQLVAMQSNMATRLEGQLARCAGVFTQQLIGSNNQQLSYCTQYGVTESDISGQMSGFYTGGGLVAMRNVQAASQASGDDFTYGIAKVWEGLAFGTATSVWGDLPYSEAVNPAIESPTLDSQESIYAAVQARLDEGITALNGISEAPTTPTQAMHGQAPGDFRMFHGSIQDFDANIWAEFLLARQDLVAGNSLVEILKTRGDPRLAAYFDANTAGQFVGHNQNNVLVRPATCPVAPAPCPPSVINTAVRRAFTFRQPLVTWAENQLILAEAKYMTGDSAGAVGHVDAVRVAVGMPALGNVSFTDVMLEKHIAMYQNIDVWADFKRTCIPLVTPFGTAAEVLGRMPYGSAERTSNPNVPLPSAYPTGTTGSSAVRNWNDPNPC